MNVYPHFAQAVEQFRHFLKSQNLPDDVVWIEPDDIALISRWIFVRSANQDDASERARAMYQRGCDRTLGVELGVLCRIEHSVCCFVYSPRDEDESARHLMPDGLKLSHPLPIPSGMTVGGKLKWAMIERLSRRWEAEKVFLFDRE